MDDYLDVITHFEAKLTDDRAGLPDGAGAVLRALVPVWRTAEDGPRVAGAEGADDEVMDLGRVLDDDELD